MSLPRFFLISKYVDPVLGVFTGGLAYYLWETHPRTAPPSDSRLYALLQWKYAGQPAQPHGASLEHIKEDLRQMRKETGGVKVDELE